MPFGLNFGGSKASNKSFVDPAQQPFLDFTRNLGQGLALRGVRGAEPFAQQAGQQLYGTGLQQLGQLTQNPFLSGLQQQAGGNPALVQQQIGNLGRDLGQFYNQQLMPQMRTDQINAGVFGGDRAAIQEGFGQQNVLDAFSRGATDIYSQDQDRALQAGISGGGLLSQGALGGLSSLSPLFNVGMGQFTGGFAPLSLFSNILGAPTVLSKGKSTSFDVGLKQGI